MKIGAILAVIATCATLSQAIIFPGLATAAAAATGAIPLIIGGKLILVPKLLAIKAGLGLAGLKIAGAKYLKDKVVLPASIAGAQAGFIAANKLIDKPKHLIGSVTPFLSGFGGLGIPSFGGLSSFSGFPSGFSSFSGSDTLSLPPVNLDQTSISSFPTGGYGVEAPEVDVGYGVAPRLASPDVGYGQAPQTISSSYSQPELPEPSYGQAPQIPYPYQPSAPEPSYGQAPKIESSYQPSFPEPSYGQTPKIQSSYQPSVPEPSYGQAPKIESSYQPSAPEPSYGQAPKIESSYQPSAPEPSYGQAPAPQPSYAAPEPTYGQASKIQSSYNPEPAPEPAYGSAPQPSYGQQSTKSSSYGAPEPSYGQQPTYSAPKKSSYGVPEPSYGQTQNAGGQQFDNFPAPPPVPENPAVAQAELQNSSPEIPEPKNQFNFLESS